MHTVLFLSIIGCVYADVVNLQDVHAKILQNVARIDKRGAYKYVYATSNDIAAQEIGVGAIRARGGFAYTSPQGSLIKLQYIADANGFQPKAEHLPVPHPTPKAILKSLEYIRTHPHPRKRPEHDQY